MNTYDILKAMSVIAPHNDVRYYMNGIHVMRGDDDEVTVEATDGHCAMRLTLSDPDTTGVTAPPFTDVILCRASVARTMKMFTRKTPPLIITTDGGQARLNGYGVDTLDGRFPTIGPHFMAPTGGVGSASGQREWGMDPALLARATKAMSKLVGDGAKFANRPSGGVKLDADTEAGRVELLVMPCRL